MDSFRLRALRRRRGRQGEHRHTPAESGDAGAALGPQANEKRPPTLEDVERCLRRSGAVFRHLAGGHHPRVTKCRKSVRAGSLQVEQPRGLAAAVCDCWRTPAAGLGLGSLWFATTRGCTPTLARIPNGIAAGHALSRPPECRRPQRIALTLKVMHAFPMTHHVECVVLLTR
jgi:hypothetical protein